MTKLIDDIRKYWDDHDEAFIVLWADWFDQFAPLLEPLGIGSNLHRSDGSRVLAGFIVHDGNLDVLRGICANQLLVVLLTENTKAAEVADMIAVSPESKVIHYDGSTAKAS